jgi:hypothetical protein
MNEYPCDLTQEQEAHFLNRSPELSHEDKNAFLNRGRPKNSQFFVDTKTMQNGETILVAKVKDFQGFVQLALLQKNLKRFEISSSVYGCRNKRGYHAKLIITRINQVGRTKQILSLPSNNSTTGKSLNTLLGYA